MLSGRPAVAVTAQMIRPQAIDVEKDDAHGLLSNATLTNHSSAFLVGHARRNQFSLAEKTISVVSGNPFPETTNDGSRESNSLSSRRHLTPPAAGDIMQWDQAGETVLIAGF